MEIEDYETESRGVEAGINPFMGAWQMKFALEPVSYSNLGAAKSAFKAAVRSKLTNKFVYSFEVKVQIVLYLNEQKMMESPAYGDLDNYAKMILDCVKGNGGILIDDCQVQSLSIHWIDVPKASHFEVEITSAPDDFVQLPLKLYEMPDGLYYPVSRSYWTKSGVVEVPLESVKVLLEALAKMTNGKRRFRHELRAAGLEALLAFQHSKKVSLALTGFHKTRVVDSGFELFSLIDWRRPNE